MDDELIQEFIEDVKDLLAELVDTLLSMENNRDNKELVSQVFRTIHYMKDASAMFGFEVIGNFTQTIEDIYDLVRNGKIEFCDDLFDLTLQSVDHITQLLYDPNLGNKRIQETHQNLIKRINIFSNNISTSKKYNRNTTEGNYNKVYSEKEKKHIMSMGIYSFSYN